MSSKNWLWQKIKNENWFSHVVMFVTTILGILIALELDKSREQADKSQKLNQYRIRLDNELKVNKGSLIEIKEWFQHDYILVEMYDYVANEKGELIIIKSKLDSLYQLDSAFRSLITVNQELPGNRVSIINKPHVRTGNMTLDTWEALKGSDILQELTPKELLSYTKIFHSINSFNSYYTSALAKSDFMTKHKLMELILNLEGFEILIGNTLSELKDERSSTGQVFEIPEPQDTSKLSRKIREFKSQD